MDWFRVYDTIIDDPKILNLSMEFRWFFVAILATSSRQFDRGSLPTLKEIAIHLRVTRPKAQRIIACFIERGLIDQDPITKGLRIHGWNKRQYKSDVSTDRVKRYREGIMKRFNNVPLAGARSETDTDTDTETEGNPPTPLPIVKQPGKEHHDVGQWAIEIMGDISWGQWVDDQGRIGHPADWVRAAIEKALSAGKRERTYVAGILRGYQRDGGPPKAQANGHKQSQSEIDAEIARLEAKYGQPKTKK